MSCPASRWFLTLLFLMVPCSSSRAELGLPGIFGDNRVLQRQKPVRVWGWAGKGETVTLRLAGQTKAATAEPAGKWPPAMDPMEAEGAPRASVVQDAAETLTFKNVVVGDV